jgi:serine phosphatase RsbU (regulator of sigma subunit)
VRLDPGDMLLAYSDGVTECRNSEDQEFEMKRLTAAANAVVGANANQFSFLRLGRYSTSRMRVHPRMI